MSQVAQTVSPTTGSFRSENSMFYEQNLSGRRSINRSSRAFRPPTDLCEIEEAIIARIEVAGMREGQLSVSITDKMLTVSGVRHGAQRRGAYYQMEIQYGEFLTEVRLPAVVDESKVEASYIDGFLTITMPKRKVLKVPVR